MKLTWEFEKKDIEAIQRVVDQQCDNPVVKSRIEGNISGQIPDTSEPMLWHTLIMCLLTSQQRSSPNSPISRYLADPDFAISLEKCRSTDDLEAFILRSLKSHGGIRFAPTIAKRAAYNLDLLENGGWRGVNDYVRDLRRQRKKSPSPVHYKKEREAAQYVSKQFKGVGPKQSRNFWMSLGLMRYEFILDSRILRWLRKLQLPIPLGAAGLADEGYYCFASDILRDLCLKADVLPCILDIAVFTSYDEKAIN